MRQRHLSAFCFLLLVQSAVACSTAIAGDIRLEGKLEPSLERDVLAVCRDVLRFYETKVATTPPLGVKPIIIRQAPDGAPRACLDGLPREYRINITCLPTRYYCQFVYQLTHELGHVYVDPRKSNWFVESCCGAMSYLAEDHMGRKWKTKPPFRNWVSYARHFHTYREGEIQRALAKVKIASAGEVEGWVRSTLPQLVKHKKVKREHQLVCAIAIEDAFKKHPDCWGALCQLGAATERGATDFGKWSDLVTEEERPVVKRLSALFGPAVEQGKTARVPK